MQFLIFGTLWFWIFSGVIGILIIWSLENALIDEYSKDNGGGTVATLIILAGIAAYAFFGSWDHLVSVGTYIKDHPKEILSYIFGYYFIGVLWSLVKWYLYLVGYKQILIKEKKSSYNDIISEHEFPTAGKNKARILTWMSYWPFSALWTLINDSVRKSFQYIFYKMESVYNKITDNVFGDLKIENDKKIQAKKEKELEESSAKRRNKEAV